MIGEQAIVVVPLILIVGNAVPFKRAGKGVFAKHETRAIWCVVEVAHHAKRCRVVITIEEEVVFVERALHHIIGVLEKLVVLAGIGRDQELSGLARDPAMGVLGVVSMGRCWGEQGNGSQERYQRTSKTRHSR